MINIRKRHLEKNTKKLREEGFVPGVIYGVNIKSTPIKMEKNKLKRVIDESGEVYQVNSASGPVYVKIEGIQKDPLTNELVHFTLMEMPKGLKSDIDVPVTLKGTPIGLKKGGVLVIMKDEVTVKGKPKTIPAALEANVSNMDIGDKLTLSDFNIPKMIDLMEENSEVIAICKPPAKEVPVIEEELATDKRIHINQDLVSFPARAI